LVGHTLAFHRHDGVPVFVLTHRPPDHPAPGHARYVTDLGSAVAQARRTPPGTATVMVHGGSTAQPLLRAGLVDELATTNTLLLVAEIAEGDIVGDLLGSRHLTSLANGPVAWVEEVMVNQARPERPEQPPSLLASPSHSRTRTADRDQPLPAWLVAASGTIAQSSAGLSIPPLAVSTLRCQPHERPNWIQTTGDEMSASVLDMSMSIDGFITGPDDGPGNGLGTGGIRLHEWLGDAVSQPPYFDPPGQSGQVFAELMATGAVVVGRKTFDYAGHWRGDHHGVPIFVPTRGMAPDPPSDWIHYVPDAATAMREAKAAAGDQDVMVHGADLAQSLLREGLLDELEIHLIPIVLGTGRRLFSADRVELELTRVLEAPGVTHLRFRVSP